MSKRQRNSSEDQEMEALAHWVSLYVKKYPPLKYLYHTPNGGYRHPVTAARLKRQLVKKGIPDLFLPDPVGRHHGLWIELKAGKGKPTPEQSEWLKGMSELGFVAVIAWVGGCEESIDRL